MILRSELAKAIATQLAYFKWLDQNPAKLSEPHFYEELATQAEVKFHTDAVFHAKVATMVNTILFVLENPATVDERRKSESELQTHYANMLCGLLVHVTTRQVIEGFIKPL